jgi:acetyltransferase-like isoleucine patch superfamily enzyme
MEILPQKVVDPRIVVLKTRLDSNKIRLQVEESKQNFFRKYGFLKPKTEKIKLINYEKYYEPYIVIGGRYSLDYCRKHDFNVEVKKHIRKIFIAGQKFEVLSSGSENHPKQVIKIVGEDYAQYKTESFFVLDRMRREISPNCFSFAPYDIELEGANEFDLNFRKVRISIDEIIDLVRLRIAKRPADFAEIIKEIFEITENSIVYRPFFEFTFHHIKAKKFVTVRIDGISGEQVIYKLKNENTNSFLSNSNIETGSNLINIKKTVFLTGENQQKNFKKIVKTESNFLKPTDPYRKPKKLSSNSDEITSLKFPAYVTGEIFLVGNNLTAVVGDMEIPSGITVTDTLVVKGKLQIGDNCHLLSKVKVLGDVVIGEKTFIESDVVSGSNVLIGSNSGVGGYVKASGKVEIGENVIIGKKLTENLDLPRDSFDLQAIFNPQNDDILV